MYYRTTDMAIICIFTQFYSILKNKHNFYKVMRYQNSQEMFQNLIRIFAVTLHLYEIRQVTH